MKDPADSPKTGEKDTDGRSLSPDSTSPFDKLYRTPFILVLSAGFMTMLDVSIVNVALPSMESALKANSDELQWIVAGYALTFGLVLIVAGRAGDILGRKKAFLIGLSIFVLASLGCGLAPTAKWLLILRLVQGAGAGILNPQVLGFIQDMFKGSARARALGVFGIIIGISTALGPVIGGLLITLIGPEHGWRFVFFINIPIGLVVIPLGIKYLPKQKFAPTVPGSILKNFDPVALMLLALIVVGVMWPFLLASADSHNPHAGTPPYWLIAISAALIVVLIFWESFWRKTGAAAILEPSLYKNPSFVLGLTGMFFYFGGFTSIFLVLTLYLQQGRGWTALAAGLASMPFAILGGVSSGVSGRLVNRFGRLVPLVGTSIVTLGMVAVAITAAVLPSSVAPVGIIISIGFAGLGSGLFIATNQVLTLEKVQTHEAGLAAALIQTFQRLGTAIGLSVITTIYFIHAATSDHSKEAKEQASAHGLSLAAIAIAIAISLTVIANIIDAGRRGELGHRKGRAQKATEVLTQQRPAG